MRERLARLSLRLGPPLAVGLVLGLLGPFGTYHLLPTGTRIGYWVAVVSVNWLLADMVLRRFEAVAGARLPAPRFSVPLLGAGLAAAPATGIVALANGLSGIGWPGNVGVLFGQVLLLMAAISLPVYAWVDMKERLDGQPDPSGPDRDTPAAAGLPLFMARLPGPLEGRLVCLEMQDHYLVVHHTRGAEMILCRMEDAARELGALGARVHRSWWVAEDAVAGVEREGQRLFLRLKDERRVPVGRSFRPGLKAAGWV